VLILAGLEFNDLRSSPQEFNDLNN